MNSPRRKPRCLSEADLAADHALRKAVRDALRRYYPDLPRPPGPGWLIAYTEIGCPGCDAYLARVHVPDVALSGLAYCPGCGYVFELLEAEGRGSPRTL